MVGDVGLNHSFYLLCWNAVQSLAVFCGMDVFRGCRRIQLGDGISMAMGCSGGGDVA